MSRTLTNDLCTGAARFRPEHVAGAAAAFGWTDDDRIYAEGMARLATTTDTEERSRHRLALLAYAAARGVRTYEGESFRAASHWAPAAIHALSFLSVFRTNPAWISLALRGRIRWQDAHELTKVLLGAGLLEASPGGPVRPRVYATRNAHTQSGLARYALHDSLLRLLQRELQFPTSEQLFRGWVLALPDSALPALRARLDAFKAELLSCFQAADARAASGQGSLDRVMQVSFQLFPVTLPLSTSLAPRTGRR